MPPQLSRGPLISFQKEPLHLPALSSLPFKTTLPRGDLDPRMASGFQHVRCFGASVQTRDVEICVLPDCNRRFRDLLPDETCLVVQSR